MASVINEVRYVALGDHAKFLRSKAREELLVGAFGSGKTRCWLTRMHERLKANPGRRALIVRKRAIWLKRTVLPLFESEVAPRYPWKNPNVQRDHREVYLYPNGAELICGGMDNPSAWRTAEYDEIGYEEAHQSTADEWEELTGRNRRFHSYPNSCFASMNPAHKGHHLFKRAYKKEIMDVFESRHWMNPKWFDVKTKTWSRDGAAYMETLKRLTGGRRARGYLSLWTSQSGQVWPQFDTERHVKAASEVPEKLDGYFASVDWGWRHAGVMQVWGVKARTPTQDEISAHLARKATGALVPPLMRYVLYRVALIYRVEKLLDWWARAAKLMDQRYRLQAIVCDPSQPGAIAAFNAALGQRDGEWIARPADNKKKTDKDFGGLDSVRYHLRDLDGRVRMFFVHPDEAFVQDPDPDDERVALGGPDPIREQDELPTSDVEEIPDYILETSDDEDEYVPDQPAKKQNDDGCDATRYATRYAETHDFAPGPEVARFEPESMGDILGHGAMLEPQGDDAGYWNAA